MIKPGTEALPAADAAGSGLAQAAREGGKPERRRLGRRILNVLRKVGANLADSGQDQSRTSESETWSRDDRRLMELAQAIAEVHKKT